MANSVIAIPSGWTGKGTSADPYRPTLMVQKGIHNYSVANAQRPQDQAEVVVKLEVTPAKLAELQGDAKIADKIIIIRERGVAKAPGPLPKNPKDPDGILEAVAAAAVEAVPLNVK